MNSYESFDQNIETFNETGDLSEYVWGTEISGFENNKAVADFVRQEIPLTHLDAVSDISYNKFTVFNTDTELANIGEINRDVAAHIGLEYYNDSKDGMATPEWTAFNKLPDLVRVYEANDMPISACRLESANLTRGENFAHVYATYIESPHTLKAMAPEHYNFMRDNVFYGREYTDA